MIIPTDKFEHLFRSWVIEVIGHYNGVIAFDGKTNHNASETDEEKSNRKSGYKDCTHKSKLHTITAYATELWFSLGQLRVDDKSNEIPAVQQLIDKVFIPGWAFTADAMHCQKETARRVSFAMGVILGRTKNVIMFLVELGAETFLFSG